ncbi:hypothetical protein F5Y14DRAFT_449029 [Nemania sp. NC0429]|nr:hypothetical protein F5Y14DRAFT_449029 [Nemania sp. NC0429]
MASRESVDSTRSTSPLIEQDSSFQPPPKYSQSHDNKAASNSNDGASKITVSAVVLGCRLVVFIASLAVGISLAVLEVWRPEHIALTVFSFLSATWNGVLMIGFLHKLSVRVSLVLSDGKVISFENGEGGGEGGRRRSCCSRAFLVDLFLVCATFATTVASMVINVHYARTTIRLNWIPIAFHIAVAALTMFPALGTAHIRFEPIETPRLSLP